MARLYLVANSDTRKEPISSTGKNRMRVELYYGSVENSQLVAEIKLKWSDHDQVPTLEVRPSRAITLEVE